MGDTFYIFSGSKFGCISIPVCAHSIIVIYISYPILYIYKLQLQINTVINIQYNLMPNFYLGFSFYTVKL